VHENPFLIRLATLLAIVLLLLVLLRMYLR
jgi:hypothetical protein